jgi:SAM-dependent methyltransferase
MKNLIPWRVRNFLSEKFPLAYHLAINMGAKGNDAVIWDRRLAENWDVMDWHTKIKLISARAAYGDKILDIACGTGSILRALRQNGFNNLHGFDTSNYAVERLRAEGFQMQRGRLPVLPYGSETFDAIIASQILEHVIRRRKFAQEIARVLKPAGTAFIFVPNNGLGPIDEPSHVIKYTDKTLTAFLADFFEVLSVEVIKEPNYTMTFLFAHVRRPAHGGQH